MKYYELVRVGILPEFAYCEEKDLETMKKLFNPNLAVAEITEELYKLAIEKNKKYHKFMKLITDFFVTSKKTA